MAESFISCRIDNSKLKAGLNAAYLYCRKSMPDLVNTAAYFVACAARKGMPFVTPDRIDTELMVIKHDVVRIGKRGKALKSRGKFFTAGSEMGEAPLAALIVAARANTDSRYNVLTNRRYALDRNPFKGVSRAQGRARMLDLVDKMIKQRHRSGKFLQAGWLPAIAIMRRHVVQKFSSQRAIESGEPNRLGNAQAAAKEGMEVSCTIENDVGLEGQNAASFNRALHVYGAGPLQEAMDNQGEREMQFALKRMSEDVREEAEKRWNEAFL